MKVLILFMTIIFLAGCSSGNRKPANQGRKPVRNAIQVNAVVANPVSFRHVVHCSGSILSNEEVEMKSEVPGKISAIHFEEGNHVSRDMLLVKINDEDLQARLKKIELQEELAASEEYRSRMLLEKKGISQQEYDNVLNRLHTLKADAALLQAEINKTEIRAPFAGTAGLRNVSVGSTISSNSVITTLQQTDPVKIEFSVPAQYSEYVKEGTSFRFITENAESFEAGVYAVEPKIDPGTRTIRARGRMANPGNRLIPGSFVKVEVSLEAISDALILPQEVVVPVLGGQKVFLCRSGKVVSSPIQAGIRTADSIQVLSGIKPGDTVITTGVMMIRDGMDVVIGELNR